MFVFGGSVKKTAELKSPILREAIFLLLHVHVDVHVHVYTCT